MRLRFIRVMAAATIAALLVAMPSLACTCNGNASFYQVARAAPVVVRAIVVEHKALDRGYRPNLATHMELRVLDVLKGVVPGDRILVAGDVGNLCRPYVSGFAKGTEWYFVLAPLAALRDGIPEFAISVCGTHWRRVTDESRKADEAEVRKALE